MKPNLKFIACAVLCGGVALSTRAQPAPASPDAAPAHARLGEEKKSVEFNKIQIQNLQGETLGRISDVAIDLINGRIVEVLVTSDSSLGVAGKIVAVPPLALTAAADNAFYRLDISAADFKAAPGIDLTKWEDAGRGDRIAATYRRFGQEPYFLEDGRTDAAPEERAKGAIGYVERSVKITGLPVGNLHGETFGKVWALSFDVLQGRILNVIILAPGNFLTKSIVPAMALSFNPARDGLLLDDTKEEYADEPRYVQTEAANGQDAHFQRESFQGQQTAGPLEQGTGYRDMDRTMLIARNVRAAKLRGQRVEIGTVNGQVTLRGHVKNEEDKRRVGEIAVAASRVELVNNQIIVAPETASK